MERLEQTYSNKKKNSAGTPISETTCIRKVETIDNIVYIYFFEEQISLDNEWRVSSSCINDSFSFDIRTFTFDINIDVAIDDHQYVNYTHKNEFQSLTDFLRQLFGCNSTVSDFKRDDEGSAFFEYEQDLTFIDAINSHMKMEFITVNLLLDVFNYKNIVQWGLVENFMDAYATFHKIKLPNNYERLLFYYNPSKEFLEKNDHKLIASILDEAQIKSKITIKLLHINPNLPLILLQSLCTLFGDKYPQFLSMINLEIFKTWVYSEDGDRSYIVLDFIHEDFDPLTNDEKYNIVLIINSLSKNTKELWALRTELIDHIRILTKLRVYFPNLKLKAKSLSEFDNEHYLYSKLASKIKQGYTIEYQFREETINTIEEPIKVIKDGKEELVYPYILKREEEYVEEGKKMKHCVASYKDKKSSIIISIRSKDKEDRVTTEYHIQNGGLVQSRYFCNVTPPDYFKTAVSKMSDRTYELSKWSKLGWVQEKRVPIKINGKEVDIVQNRLESRDYENIRNINDIAEFLV